MHILGAEKFYKPHDSSLSDKDNQILKNSGYISILLHSVLYNSKGNLWQEIFGGVDTIALATSTIYKPHPPENGLLRWPLALVLDQGKARTHSENSI